MFDNLTDKLGQTFKKLRGHGKLSERNINETLKEIRTHLLEADVNYVVAKNFLNTVKEKAMGKEVMESLTPGQQFVRLFNRELIQQMVRNWPKMKDIAAKARKPFAFVVPPSGGKFKDIQL